MFNLSIKVCVLDVFRTQIVRWHMSLGSTRRLRYAALYVTCSDSGSDNDMSRVAECDQRTKSSAICLFISFCSVWQWLINVRLWGVLCEEEKPRQVNSPASQPRTVSSNLQQLFLLKKNSVLLNKNKTSSCKELKSYVMLYITLW